MGQLAGATNDVRLAPASPGPRQTVSRPGRLCIPELLVTGRGPAMRDSAFNHSMALEPPGGLSRSWTLTGTKTELLLSPASEDTRLRSDCTKNRAGGFAPEPLEGRVTERQSSEGSAARVEWGRH
jgi:hypothetical protein